MDGVWVLSINEDNGKRVKTRAGIGVVPISSALIRLGFLDYASVMLRCKTSRLFPGLGIGKSRASRYASRWFSEYRKLCGVGIERDREKNFHSFRHTVVTTLRPLFEENYIQALVGHEQKSVTMQRYGHGLPVAKLREMVEALDFGVDLSHLEGHPMVKS